MAVKTAEGLLRAGWVSTRARILYLMYRIQFLHVYRRIVVRQNVTYCESEIDRGCLVKKSRKIPLSLLLAAAMPLCSKPISAQSSSEIPVMMLQCEPDSCGTWSFQGKQGTGKWQTGPVANLTVERFDAGGISI